MLELGIQIFAGLYFSNFKMPVTLKYAKKFIDHRSSDIVEDVIGIFTTE